jgi:hypothetical protein
LPDAGSNPKRAERYDLVGWTQSREQQASIANFLLKAIISMELNQIKPGNRSGAAERGSVKGTGFSPYIKPVGAA